MSAAEAGGEAARIVFDTVRVSSLISERPASLRLSAFNLRRTSIPAKKNRRSQTFYHYSRFGVRLSIIRQNMNFGF